MTSTLIEFIKEYIPAMIGAGVGFGSLVALVSILGGYAISKTLSLVDNT